MESKNIKVYESSLNLEKEKKRIKLLMLFYFWKKNIVLCMILV